MFIFPSCEKDPIDGDIIVDNELLERLYSESTDTLTIENQILVLNTELYRNFFPGGLPESRPLTASVDIINIDSTQILDNIKINKLYVINNEQMWISTPIDCDNCYLPEYVLRINSSNGPEWETNIFVDVIIEIIDIEISTSYYLIAEDQLIYKVE